MGKKKRRSEARMETEEEEGMDETGPESVEVDFEGFPPEDVDHGGICGLLRQLIGAKESEAINLSQLAEAIIEQSPMGTVLKTAIDDDDEDEEDEIDDEDSIFGLTSVLRLDSKKEAVGQLLGHFRARLEKAKKKRAGPQLSELKSALEAGKESKLCLLLNERMVNIPHQVAAPALEALLSDLEPSKKVPEAFLLLVKMAGSRAEGKETEEIQFTNAEEELLMESAEAWAEWDVNAGEQEQAVFFRRRLCLLSLPQIKDWIARIQAEL